MKTTVVLGVASLAASSGRLETSHFPDDSLKDPAYTVPQRQVVGHLFGHFRSLPQISSANLTRQPSQEAGKYKIFYFKTKLEWVLPRNLFGEANFCVWLNVAG